VDNLGDICLYPVDYMTNDLRTLLILEQKLRYNPHLLFVVGVFVILNSYLKYNQKKLKCQVIVLFYPRYGDGDNDWDSIFFNFMSSGIGNKSFHPLVSFILFPFWSYSRFI